MTKRCLSQRENYEVCCLLREHCHQIEEGFCEYEEGFCEYEEGWSDGRIAEEINHKFNVSGVDKTHIATRRKGSLGNFKSQEQKTVDRVDEKIAAWDEGWQNHDKRITTMENEIFELKNQMRELLKDRTFLETKNP